MIGKLVFFIYFVGVSNSVLIDTSDNHDKDWVKTNPQSWQMVEVHHPRSRPFGYKHGPYAYPKYVFEYSVSDNTTGDHKHHREDRDGNQVRGEYSLVESDGSLRKVQYHADDHNGFNAVVSKTVSKHGDHATSVSDITQFFYPVTHNIKINHYVPSKYYHYQEIERPENDVITKPVHEKSTDIKTEEYKMVSIESSSEGDSLIQENLKGDEGELKESAPQDKTPILKAEVTVPVQIVPATVSDFPEDLELQKLNPKIVTSEPTVEKTEDLHPNELPSENKEIETEDQSDSEASSSRYRTHFYYVTY